MTYTFSKYDKLQKGSPAPPFELPDTQGKKRTLEKLRGPKATLVVFMCNHCPYVVPKVERLVLLQETYGPQGLRTIGINANNVKTHPDDSPEKMKAFVKEHGINFPYLFDESQDVPRAYGATCTPDPFLFDKELLLAYHGRIDDAHGKPHAQAKTNELEQAIIDVLAGKHVSAQTLPSAGCNIKWK